MTESRPPEESGKLSLTAKIMIAMGLGIVVGVIFDTLGSTFIDTHVVSGFFAMIGTMLSARSRCSSCRWSSFRC